MFYLFLYLPAEGQFGKRCSWRCFKFLEKLLWWTIFDEYEKDIFGSLSYGGSYKIYVVCLSVVYLCLSVRLSICLSVCQFGIFLRNGSLVFFCFFFHMVDNWKISKMTEAIFTGKLIFAQIWAKSAQYGPKMSFGFFEKFCH